MRWPKNFISQGLGSEMKIIEAEKQVSIVFRHEMFCVNQAETSLKNLTNPLNLI